MTSDKGFLTELTHSGRAGPKARGMVNPSVHRGSTVLFSDTADRVAVGHQRYDQALVYGVLGNATHHALEDMVAMIEGGTRCQIVSSGLAACTTALLAYAKAGDHVLMPDSVYGPVRRFCDTMLMRMGVITEYYLPELDEAGVQALMRPNTTILYAESPGSHSFEMQDVPALARIAHAQGAKLLFDNTWGIHHFMPFEHGVDVSIQALTKYVVGHSDVLLGSITVSNDADWKIVRDAALQLGQYASPDDCWLALRGGRTMGVRLQHQMAAALKVAAWFRDQEQVRQVLFPALPGAPGHELWKRDFTGACSLFGIEFQPDIKAEAVYRFSEALRLFGIGESWGGFESLVLPTTGFISRSFESRFAGPVCRFHIGLEDVDDLIADLKQAMPVLRASA